MAIGFTPKYTASFPLNELSREQCLILALAAIAKLGWGLRYISHTGIVANTYADNGTFSLIERNSEVTLRIDGGNVSVRAASTGNEMMDWGRNKKAVRSFITALEALKADFTTEELAGRYEALQPSLPPEEEDALLLPTPTISSQLSDFMSIFKPSKGYFITPLILDLNIVLFGLMILSGVNMMEPDSDSLLRWGANFRPLTLEGQWRRLVTCCFLHIGIFHLLMNMYALVLIGAQLEPRLGKARFFTAYFLTGIAASMTSLWWHDLNISAGASGAIFGMYGVFLALLTTKLIEETARKSLLMSIGIFVAYNLLYGMKGGIDNAAHIGGVVSGFFIGYAYLPGLKKPSSNGLKFGVIGLLSLLILVSSFLVYKRLPNDIGRYDAGMKTFAATEIAALAVYKLPDSASAMRVMRGFKEEGIDNWIKAEGIIDSMGRLNLPLALHERNRKLKAYCALRLETYQLTIKAIEENTVRYRDSIDAKNRRIEKLIREIGGGKENK